MAGNINIINIEKIKIILNPLRWFNKIRFKKSNVRILFIDDKNMPIVQNLKKSGWSVEKVEDIENIDSDIIRQHHIIFVDYKGVGKVVSPKYEGIGLAGSIKEKYGKKKYIILYSANGSFEQDAVLSKYLKIIDYSMLKNADFTEFMEVINDGIKQLR